MNVALVENAKNYVDGDDRCEDQVGLRCQGVLERLRSPLESRHQSRRQGHSMFGSLNCRDCVSEGKAWRKVEGDRHRGKQALMIDGNGCYGFLEVREHSHWHELPRSRGTHIQ